MTNTRAKEWDALSYHRVSQPQQTWGQQVMSKLLLRGDETVVDAGCGTGHLTAALLDRLPRGRVIALDQSKQMLDQARDFLSPTYGDRVSYMQADLQELTLERPVDVVFSTATFHWVLDHPKLFGRLFRALRPGGLLLAQCGGLGNLTRLRDRARAVLRRPDFAELFDGWPEPWTYPDDDVTEARLLSAGFIDVSTDLTPAPTPFEDAAAFREFITTVVLRPFVQHIPDEARRRILLDTAVEAAALDTPPFTLDYIRLNLRARRPH